MYRVFSIIFPWESVGRSRNEASGWFPLLDQNGIWPLKTCAIYIQRFCFTTAEGKEFRDILLIQMVQSSILLLLLFSFWPTVLSVVPLARCVVCRLSSVTFCIVAKWYVLAKKCLKEWIGNQDQKVDFFRSPPYFYFRFRLYGHRDGRFCLIFARTAQQLILDGTNWLSSSKPCAYCLTVQSELKPDSGLFVCTVHGCGLPWALATGH